MDHNLGVHLWDIPAPDFNPTAVKVGSSSERTVIRIDNLPENRCAEPGVRAHRILHKTLLGSVLLSRLWSRHTGNLETCHHYDSYVSNVLIYR